MGVGTFVGTLFLELAFYVCKSMVLD